MARLCAKPTCSSTAVSWFDADPGNQRVVEQSAPTETAIALCEPHAERFSVPDGWTLVPVPTPAETSALVASPVPSGEALIDELAGTAPKAQRNTAPKAQRNTAPKAQRNTAKQRNTAPKTQRKTAKQRRHTRESPWFLSESPRRDPEPSTNSEVSAAGEPDDDGAEPTVGSLLHRAFHGPDRAIDSVRARSAERDTPTVSARVSPSSDDGDLGDVKVASVRSIASGRRARSVTSYDVELPFPPADSSQHVAVS